VRRALPLVSVVAIVVAAPAAHAQPAMGEGCGPTERSLRDSQLAFAAHAQGFVRAYAAPGGKVRRVFPRMNQNGVANVFGVLAVSRDRACEPVWYRVQLPMRPNGAVGYVRANAVSVRPVRTRIEVDLSSRRLALFRDGRLVLRTTAGTGTSKTPTPTGRYYVNQRFRVRDAGSPFGPAAIGISAFSPVLTGWAQGGPIAIHGTSDPSSVGRAASHGCLRLQNRVVLRLLWATKTGSPVVIHA
jgi:L,D-transpeptidase catalytic domain